MGNIRIIKEGLDFNSLPHGEEDRVLEDFLHMKNKAEYYKDQLCILNTIFCDFINKYYQKAWSPSLYPGISQRNYQKFFVECSQRPKPFKPFNDETEYNRLPEPKIDGGFEISPLPKSYIYDVSTWHEWRIDYFSKNPDQIDWSYATSDLLPEPQFTQEIIQQELKNNNIKDTTTQALHQLILSNDSGAKVACIDRIGTEICHVNYYIEEKTLANRERLFSNSKRKIFSIIHNKHKQYISLDFEKGRFEFFNERGEHQGEFYFDGSRSSKSRTDPQHQLHLT